MILQSPKTTPLTLITSSPSNGSPNNKSRSPKAPVSERLLQVSHPSTATPTIIHSPSPISSRRNRDHYNNNSNSDNNSDSNHDNSTHYKKANSPHNGYRDAEDEDDDDDVLKEIKYTTTTTTTAVATSTKDNEDKNSKPTTPPHRVTRHSRDPERNAFEKQKLIQSTLHSSLPSREEPPLQNTETQRFD